MDTLEREVSAELRPKVHHLRNVNRWLTAGFVFFAAAAIVLGGWMLATATGLDADEQNMLEAVEDYVDALNSGDEVTIYGMYSPGASIDVPDNGMLDAEGYLEYLAPYAAVGDAGAVWVLAEALVSGDHVIAEYSMEFEGRSETWVSVMQFHPTTLKVTAEEVIQTT